MGKSTRSVKLSVKEVVLIEEGKVQAGPKDSEPSSTGFAGKSGHARRASLILSYLTTLMNHVSGDDGWRTVGLTG